MAADPHVTPDLESLPHILVVDDDDRISRLVSRYLNEHGFFAITAGSAADAREILKRASFDALIVDIMMPGENGLSLTQGLRKTHDLPVLLLTALGETDDKIAGLQAGADDYLPKPFDPRELVLRLQAILRRRPKVQPPGEAIRIGGWMFDPAINTLDNGKDATRLTDGEAALLKALASRPGEIFSREALALLCGLEDGGERTIDVQVTRLRRKLGEDSKAPRYLQTVRGKGYLLRTGEV